MYRCLCQTQNLLQNIQVHNPLQSKPLLTAVLNWSQRQQGEETWIRAGRWSTHNCKYLSNVAHLVSPSPHSAPRQPMSACGRTVATNSSALYNSTVATATVTIHSLQTHKNKHGLDSENSPTWINSAPSPEATNSAPYAWRCPVFTDTNSLLHSWSYDTAKVLRKFSENAMYE